MTNQQTAQPVEDGRTALAQTLFGEGAPKLRNIKCFVEGGLTTASDISHIANDLIRDRRSGKVPCLKKFPEHSRDRQTAAELIATL